MRALLQRFSLEYSGITNHGDLGERGDVYGGLQMRVRDDKWYGTGSVSDLSIYQ